MNKKIICISIIGLFLITSFTTCTALSTKTLVSRTSLTSQNIVNSGETGFFRVEQVDDRWHFTDPEGNPFFSTGVCSIRASGYFAPDLNCSPYYDNIMNLYGSEEAWANVTHDRLVSWNFNTIGSWSDQYIIDTGLSYTVMLDLAMDKDDEIADYFSKEWEEKVDQKCQDVVVNLSNDPNLIGYFLDNEVHWGVDWKAVKDLFAEYCSLSYNSPGKIALVEFLKERYNGNIIKFNLAWRTLFKNFDEILNVSSLGSLPKTLHSSYDRRAFTYFAAERFFKVCNETIRKYDKNHLILGARFQSYLTPIEVVQAAAHYVDVISVNHYSARPLLNGIVSLLERLLGFINPKNTLQDYYDATNKPILVSEFNFRAYDSGLPNTLPPPLLFPVVLTQTQRANHFESEARDFIKKSYIVGYHWYAYMDEPETGRFDGENSNTGIVNVTDDPYETLVSRMTEINRLAQESVETQP